MKRVNRTMAIVSRMDLEDIAKAAQAVRDAWHEKTSGTSMQETLDALAEALRKAKR